jgi:hypothetical protein
VVLLVKGGTDFEYAISISEGHNPFYHIDMISQMVQFA